MVEETRECDGGGRDVEAGLQLAGQPLHCSEDFNKIPLLRTQRREERGERRLLTDPWSSQDHSSPVTFQPGGECRDESPHLPLPLNTHIVPQQENFSSNWENLHRSNREMES